jgi:hypothetical protein
MMNARKKTNKMRAEIAEKVKKMNRMQWKMNLHIRKNSLRLMVSQHAKDKLLR